MFFSNYWRWHWYVLSLVIGLNLTKCLPLLMKNRGSVPIFIAIPALAKLHYMQFGSLNNVGGNRAPFQSYKCICGRKNVKWGPRLWTLDLKLGQINLKRLNVLSWTWEKSCFLILARWKYLADAFFAKDY